METLKSRARKQQVSHEQGKVSRWCPRICQLERLAGQLGRFPSLKKRVPFARRSGSQTLGHRSAGTIFSRPRHSHAELYRPVLGLVDESFSLVPRAHGSHNHTAGPRKSSLPTKRRALRLPCLNHTLFTREPISVSLRTRTESRRASFEMRVSLSLARGEQRKPS